MLQAVAMCLAILYGVRERSICGGIVFSLCIWMLFAIPIMVFLSDSHIESKRIDLSHVMRYSQQESRITGKYSHTTENVEYIRVFHNGEPIETFKIAATTIKIDETLPNSVLIRNTEVYERPEWMSKWVFIETITPSSIKRGDILILNK